MPILFAAPLCPQEGTTTTKLLVVFDGSASKFSLNDILMTGPTIQTKVMHTQLRGTYR